jgi:hypothetical protein
MFIIINGESTSEFNIKSDFTNGENGQFGGKSGNHHGSIRQGRMKAWRGPMENSPTFRFPRSCQN